MATASAASIGTRRSTTIVSIEPLAIEAEIHAERAAALGRAGAALAAALEAWKQAPSDATYQEAQKRLSYLLIHREALGILRHREVFEAYGVPRSWWY